MSSIAKSPLIIGHRGASAVAPENTMVAFAKASADGADGIEFDVRLAHDGVPVVIHDATLKRTGGVTRVVAEMSSAELARIDVGSWFNRAHPNVAQREYSHEFVPTLEQVFEMVRSRNQIAYVELKIDRGQDYRALVGSVAELISSYKLQDQIIVISFNLKAVALMKELNPLIRTGALFEPRRNAHSVVRKHPMIAAALDCGASEILLHRLMATRRMIGAASDACLLPVVWTVDDPNWIAKAQARRIHALITNNLANMIVDPKK